MTVGGCGVVTVTLTELFGRTLSGVVLLLPPHSHISLPTHPAHAAHTANMSKPCWMKPTDTVQTYNKNGKQQVKGKERKERIFI